MLIAPLRRNSHAREKRHGCQKSKVRAPRSLPRDSNSDFTSAMEIANSGANLVSDRNLKVDFSRNPGCALADFYGHYSSRDLQFCTFGFNEQFSYATAHHTIQLHKSCMRRIIMLAFLSTRSKWHIIIFI